MRYPVVVESNSEDEYTAEPLVIVNADTVARWNRESIPTILDSDLAQTLSRPTSD